MTQQQYVNPFGQQPVQPPAFPPHASVPAQHTATPPAFPAQAAVATQAPSPFGAPGQPLAAGADPFGAPAPPPGKAPRMQDLYDWATGHGRLLLLAPFKLEVVPNTLSPTPGATQERITFDMAVLDGGEIHFGGTPEKRPPVPHNKVAQVPVLFEAVYNSHTAIVNACRQALTARATGSGTWMVLGRLFVGQNAKPGQNPPWLIGRPDLPLDRQMEGPTEEERQIARAFLASKDAEPMLSRPRGA